MLDTNTLLQRFQPDNDRAKCVIDLLYQNKKVELHLPAVCFSETIQQFYYAHRDSQSDPDPISEQERDELVNNLMQDIKNKRLWLYPMTDSLFAKTTEIFNTSFVTPCKGREPICVIDMLVIAVALELKRLGIVEVEIYSSDFHLCDTARAMGIDSYDPKTVCIDDLPSDINRRKVKRPVCELPIICNDLTSTSARALGRTQTVNICEGGICIKHPNRKISRGDRLNLKILHSEQQIFDGNGTVTWSDEEKAGIKVDQRIDISLLPR